MVDIFNLLENIVAFQINFINQYNLIIDGYLILKAFIQKVCNQIIQMYHNNSLLTTF